jgi:hypothetical protein
MTASPYASAAKIDEALAAIGAEHVGTREQTLLQQIFVACATEGSSPPTPSVPQNLRLAAAQNPDSITVTWDALPSSPDYDVEVYTPDDVWVPLGGTMGGITREYGVSDGMVYGGTYSFRVRSTFDFVTFSDWSAPLYGVVAPLQTLYYVNQGSGQWNDAANWFEDGGSVPHGAIPTASYNCVIISYNTLEEVPSGGYNSVVNIGTVTTNNGTVTINYGTVATNIGTVATNNGTVTNNNGTVTTNESGGAVTSNESSGTVTSNNGTVSVNNGTVSTNYGTVSVNYGTVSVNNGTVSTNYGTVTTNNGMIYNNDGTVTTNTASGTITNNYVMITINDGTVENNSSSGVIVINNGTVYQNCGTILNDQGTSGPCP